MYSLLYMEELLPEQIDYTNYRINYKYSFDPELDVYNNNYYKNNATNIILSRLKFDFTDIIGFDNVVEEMIKELENKMPLEEYEKIIYKQNNNDGENTNNSK